MTFKCPSGQHESTDADFCSECGLQLAAQTVSASAGAASASGESCPKCSTERDDPDSPFCGVCGYNFQTKQGGDYVAPVEVTPAPAAKEPLTVQPPPAVNTTSGARIDIEVTFDESNAEAPKGVAPLKFSLFDEESLIGRRSSSVPQSVGLDGDGYVSRRHILIIRQPNGTYVVRVISTTNGASVNGVEIGNGEERPIKEGDRIVIGAFTIITVSAIR